MVIVRITVVLLGVGKIGWRWNGEGEGEMRGAGERRELERNRPQELRGGVSRLRGPLNPYVHEKRT